MHTSIRPITWAMVLTLAAGCTTNPVRSGDARAVPNDRIISESLTRPFNGAGAIAITRDDGMLASTCSIQVLIDGEPVAQMRAGERIEIYTAPGEHILGAQPSGLCSLATRIEAAATSTAGKIRSYRISAGSSGEYVISPTTY